jgi:DNA repair photolyase
MEGVMEMKAFKGKAIYNPSGKAGEYSYWACNFYVGCSNGCEYCYLKKGRGAAVLGGCEPKLKACFKNEKHALEVFEKEFKANIAELRECGLFFSFTTDPMLPETIELTSKCVKICMINSVPVKILTKRAEWYNDVIEWINEKDGTIKRKNLIAFGFTLTGHDELEPGASTNIERIEAMKKLHNAGFKTFASIEPIIDIQSSYRMVEETYQFCDLYKIGPESGKKYSINEFRELYARVSLLISCRNSKAKVYWKDGYLNILSITREDCTSMYNFNVTRDYNMFTNK